MNTWVYIFDEFKIVDVDASRLFEFAERKPLELFNDIKEVVEEYVKDIRSVRVHKVYIDRKVDELVIEYIVKSSFGEVSAKLIYSKNPREALLHYYNYEKSI